MVPLVCFKIEFQHRKVTLIRIHGAIFWGFFPINILARRLSGKKKQMVSLPHLAKLHKDSVAIPPMFKLQTQAAWGKGFSHLRERWSFPRKGLGPPAPLPPNTPQNPNPCGQKPLLQACVSQSAAQSAPLPPPSPPFTLSPAGPWGASFTNSNYGLELSFNTNPVSCVRLRLYEYSTGCTALKRSFRFQAISTSVAPTPDSDLWNW